MEGHQRGTSERTAHDPRRPSLERPSLFAGPDDDTADTDGLRSVRILSTLESQERGKGAPSRRAAPATERTGTQRLLWALVVTGLASTGAALWWAAAPWLNAPPTAPTPDKAARHAAVASGEAAAREVSATDSTAASTAAATTPPTKSSSTSTPLAALIENTPPATGPSVLTIRPSEVTAPSATAAKDSPEISPVKASTKATKVLKAEAGDKSDKAGKSKARPKTTESTGHTTRDKRAHTDRDVELLEAVMSHTERRTRP